MTTPYGDGEVLSYRPGASAAPGAADPQDPLAAFYELRLSHGATAFVRPVVVARRPAAGDAAEVPSLGGPAASADALCAPLGPEAALPEEDALFIGPQCAYGFFRLYALLQKRLQVARDLAEAAKRDALALGAEQEEAKGEDGMAVEGAPAAARGFPLVLNAVYALLNGGMDAGAFEDACRALMGNASYVLFTVDKLVAQIVRHLHAMANDATMRACIKLHRFAAARALLPMQYIRAARTLTHGREDALFKVHVASDQRTPQQVAAAVASQRKVEAPLAPSAPAAPLGSPPPAFILCIELLGTSVDMLRREPERIQQARAFAARADERQRREEASRAAGAEPPQAPQAPQAPPQAPQEPGGGAPGAMPMQGMGGGAEGGGMMVGALGAQGSAGAMVMAPYGKYGGGARMGGAQEMKMGGDMGKGVMPGIPGVPLPGLMDGARGLMPGMPFPQIPMNPHQLPQHLRQGFQMQHHQQAQAFAQPHAGPKVVGAAPMPPGLQARPPTAPAAAPQMPQRDVRVQMPPHMPQVPKRMPAPAKPHEDDRVEGYAPAAPAPQREQPAPQPPPAPVQQQPPQPEQGPPPQQQPVEAAAQGAAPMGTAPETAPAPMEPQVAAPPMAPPGAAEAPQAEAAPHRPEGKRPLEGADQPSEDPKRARMDM